MYSHPLHQRKLWSSRVFQCHFTCYATKEHRIRVSECDSKNSFLFSRHGTFCLAACSATMSLRSSFCSWLSLSLSCSSYLKYTNKEKISAQLKRQQQEDLVRSIQTGSERKTKGYVFVPLENTHLVVCVSMTVTPKARNDTANWCVEIWRWYITKFFAQANKEVCRHQ